MTSQTSIGNDAEGTVLASIEGRALGLDAAGNIVLNTELTYTKAPSRGVPGVVGVGIPFNVGLTNNVGASTNIANVNCQVQDVYGNPIAGVFDFDLYLSDAATGAGLTATTASGGIAVTVGTVLGVLTAAKALRVQTNAAGLFTLAITDSAHTGFYPVSNLIPGIPNQVGAQLTTASYHA